MRAYSWIALGTVALACGGSAFTGDPGSTGGDGGTGDTGDGANAGALNRAGRGSGGSLIGIGGKVAGGGTTSKAGGGGTTSSGGVIGVGGDLGIAGDLVVGGSSSMGGQVGTAGTTSTAGTGGTSPDPGDKVCPKTQPAPGTACTNGLVCSYGEDVRTACRPVAKCVNKVWSINKPVCEQLHGCNAVIVGKACDANAAKPCLLNATDGIYCVCTGCGSGGPCSDQTVWACAAGDGAQGCPKLAPNEGQMCVGDPECGYGSCTTGNGAKAVCDGTTWSWNGVICPL